MEKFKGIFTALLTPFNSDWSLNEKALEQLIELNIEKGVDGFYVNGSTAEVFMLTEEERRRLYKLVSEIVGGRRTLIAHIGCVSTLQTIEYGRLARQLGYDAISSVAPFYYKFTFDEIKSHYFMTVDSVGLPMIIYNFPAMSGVSLSADQIGEFLCDDRFIGVKHTSSDYFALQQFKADYPGKIIYNGYDETFLAGLAMGADGGIGSTYNLMADKFIRIKRLYESGDTAGALREQGVANAIIRALCKLEVARGEKAVMKLMGIDLGDARPPYKKLTREDFDFAEKTIMPLL